MAEGSFKASMSKADKVVLAALVLGSFMTALDGTIVSVAIPTIAEEFGESGRDTSNISWILLIYTLMLGCFILLWAKLGTNIGYKKVFVIGVSVFTVSSLAIGVCGTAFPHLGMGAIIALRAVQGLGAGMAMAMSLAMVSAYLPSNIRGSAIGMVTLSSSAGTAFGPALGGLLTAIDWSFIFFINVPIGIVCLLLCRGMKNNAPESHARLDYIGALFLFVMLFSLIYYLNQASDIGWTSEAGIGLLALAFLAAGMVAWWEGRTGDPLISLKMVANRHITGPNVICMLLFMAMAGSYLLLPYYLQYVKGYSTVEYGFILVANSIGMMVAGPAVGKAADRTGTCKQFIVIGSLISALGFFLLTMLTKDSGLLFIVLSLFVMGAGIGMALVGATNFAFKYIAPGEDGQLSGLTNTFRSTGSSAGVATLGAVFGAFVVSSAPDIVSAIMPGFKHAFFIAIILSLMAFVIAMGLKEDDPKAVSGE
jgi:EmrB/QacA subfamily drug resistance transporter